MQAYTLLPGRLAAEPERLHRFEQEARATSALSQRQGLPIATACCALAVSLSGVISCRQQPAPAPTAALFGSDAVASASDFAHDGTPDFLRLDSEEDRQAFAGWFTFLAEAQYFQEPVNVTREINDCAALIRFAYREALREHSGEWASGLRLSQVPPLPPVVKYRYPFTPLGAALFRVRPGEYSPADLSIGTFAQFADAQTLKRWNTHFISRDIDRAEPADLLFFEQLNQDLPFHAMIFLGESQFEPGGERWVVYHTGPESNQPGEIRRPSVAELRRHPLPQWRPLSGNRNFLGVYRWNILRDSETVEIGRRGGSPD